MDDPSHVLAHAKQDPAALFEVAYWVLSALRQELATGIGEYLTPATYDFRGIRGLNDSFVMDDIPDDPLRASLILVLHSGQHFRISIEEK